LGSSCIVVILLLRIQFLSQLVFSNVELRGTSSGIDIDWRCLDVLEEEPYDLYFLVFWPEKKICTIMLVGVLAKNSGKKSGIESDSR
jgi:hypothetical protein